MNAMAEEEMLESEVDTTLESKSPEKEESFFVKKLPIIIAVLLSLMTAFSGFVANQAEKSYFEADQIKAELDTIERQISTQTLSIQQYETLLKEYENQIGIIDIENQELQRQRKGYQEKIKEIENGPLQFAQVDKRHIHKEIKESQKMVEFFDQLHAQFPEPKEKLEQIIKAEFLQEGSHLQKNDPFLVEDMLRQAAELKIDVAWFNKSIEEMFEMQTFEERPPEEERYAEVHKVYGEEPRDRPMEGEFRHPPEERRHIEPKEEYRPPGDEHRPMPPEDKFKPPPEGEHRPMPPEGEFRPQIEEMHKEPMEEEFRPPEDEMHPSEEFYEGDMPPPEHDPEMEFDPDYEGAGAEHEQPQGGVSNAEVIRVVTEISNRQEERDKQDNIREQREQMLMEREETMTRVNDFIGNFHTMVQNQRESLEGDLENIRENEIEANQSISENYVQILRIDDTIRSNEKKKDKYRMLQTQYKCIIYGWESNENCKELEDYKNLMAEIEKTDSEEKEGLNMMLQQQNDGLIKGRDSQYQVRDAKAEDRRFYDETGDRYRRIPTLLAIGLFLVGFAGNTEKQFFKLVFSILGMAVLGASAVMFWQINMGVA